MMIFGCSNYPKIISSTDDQLVLKAKPESFVDAYDVAKKECDKNARIAQYISNGTDSLGEVAFNCFDPNAEAGVLAEAEVDTETETTIEEEAELEAVSEEISEEGATIETVSEEALEETLEEVPVEETVQ